MSKTAQDLAQLTHAELLKTLLELQAKQDDLTNINSRLQAKNASYENLLDYAAVGLLVINKSAEIEHVNNIACRLLNVEQADVVGKPIAKHLAKNSREPLQSFLTVLQTSQIPQSTSLPISGKNGINIELLCHGCIYRQNEDDYSYMLLLETSSLQNQQEHFFSEIINKLERDLQAKNAHLTESNFALKQTVAELNHSKHQLLEREAKLNSILNASIEGIIVIDTGGTIVSVNSAVEKIFNFSADELIGNSVTLLMPFAMQVRQDKFLKKYLRMFIPGVIGQIREVEGVRKDGSTVPLDMTIAEFPLDGMHYYSGIVRDVSTRKLQEQKEKDHLEKLAHVTRLGLMGEMASGIAHEVNQPLSAVVNYTQVCLRLIQNESLDMAKLGEILLKANQSALKAGQIIHSMREFVKPRKIHRAVTDINELIHDAISLFEPDFKQHLIEMRFDLTKNLPTVVIDRVQIEQVILNLIRNSIDALKELPQFTQRQMSVETSLNDLNYLEVRVKDNGPGLSDIQREKILTPFFTTKTTGMGMGLSISRSLVEAHHGTLHFNSKEDKGTTFYFTLPTETPTNG